MRRFYISGEYLFDIANLIFLLELIFIEDFPFFSGEVLKYSSRNQSLKSLLVIVRKRQEKLPLRYLNLIG